MSTTYRTSKISQGYRPGNPGLQARLQKLLTSLCYHILTIYLTCSNNIWDVVLPGFVFGVINSTLAAPRLSMGPALPLSHVLLKAPRMLLWSWSNLFMFCLHNQRQPANIAEDRVNKPWRPIPSGRITPEQARRLLYVMHPFCLALSLWGGGLVPYALLTFSHVWYNEFQGAEDGIMKNVFNGIGLGCFYAGPLEIAMGRSVFSSGANYEAALWIGLLMASFGTSCHLQDFRDVEGDLLAGRRTIPLMFGDTTARVLAVMGVALWTEVACQFWAVGVRQRLVPLAPQLLLSANIFLDRTHAGDTRTWNMWPLWVWSMFALPCMSAA